MKALNRRSFIAAASCMSLIALPGCAGSSMGRKSAPFVGRNRLPIGVQLFTLFPDLETDFDGTLAKLRALGVQTVELAYFHGRTAEQIRASFERAGLTCTSAHAALTPREGTTPEAHLDALALDMHTIGVTDVVLPLAMLPNADRTAQGILTAAAAMKADDWRRIAQGLNGFGRALRQRDLRFSYHNHNIEFAPLGSETAFDILLRETDPSLVSFEIDTGWVAAAGHDPADLLNHYPGRFTQMHVKDIKAITKPNFTMQQDPVEVGSGKLDWATILPAAHAAGVRRFYIEQEPPFAGPRLDSIAKSASYLFALRAP